MARFPALRRLLALCFAFRRFVPSFPPYFFRPVFYPPILFPFCFRGLFRSVSLFVQLDIGSSGFLRGVWTDIAVRFAFFGVLLALQRGDEQEVFQNKTSKWCPPK
jgi:hypothetical protein